ncbi:MAG: hypothetical protein ABJB78_04665 [Betaproteobacteria bacterium]
MHKLQTLVIGAVAAVVTAHAAGAATSITPEQRARLAERLQLADQVVHAVAADLRASANAVERRQWLQEALYTMPLEKLRTLGVPPTFQAVSDAIARAQKTTAKAIGDTSTDLVYRPITPCRYIDTRNVGGPITTPRSFDLGLTGATYGGSLGCNPVAASGVGNVNEIAAVSINVAIVSPTAQPGFLGVRPAGSSNTTAFVNWYLSGPTIQASNSGVVTAAQGAGDDIEFFGSPTQVVVDVMGVFARPAATALDCVTLRTQGSGTNNLPTATDYVFPIPSVCTTGYTAVSVGCEYGPAAPAGLTLTSASTPGANFYACAWRNDTGTTLDQSNFNTHTRCCRLPGR